MKKICTTIAALSIVAGVAFAQTATTPAADAAPKNTEIYGQTWFEYGYSNSQASSIGDNQAKNFGTFTLGAPNGDKVRIGVREAIQPNLKAQVEVDVATMELKQANVAYVPVSGLTLKAGRMNKLFAQFDSAIYGSRWQGVSGVYDFGAGYVGLGVGNEIDEKYNKYYAFNLTNAGALVGSTYAQQPYTKFQPAIGFRAINDKDVKLEIGGNGEFGIAKSGILTSSIKKGTASKDGTTVATADIQNLKTFTASVDGYVNLYAYGLTATGEFTYANLEQSNKSLDAAYEAGYDVWQRPTFFGQLSYNLDKVTPTVTYVWDTYYTKNDSTLNIEAPYTITSGLVLNPVFSYAISGYNYNDAVYNANKSTHDWTLGLRVDYKFSSKF